MSHDKNATAKKTVSLPEELLEKGLERSKEQNRSFSSYVQNLISKDLNGTLNTAPAHETAKAA